MSSTFDQETDFDAAGYPPVDETQEHTGRRWPRVLAGVGVVGALGIGGLLAFGDDDDPVAATGTTVAALDEPAPETTAAPGTTSTRPETSTTPAGSVEVSGVELALSTEDSPVEILGILAGNRTEVANFVDFSDYTEQQSLNEDFIRYVAFDPSGDYAQQQLEVWRNAQQYKQGDAFVEYDIRFVDVEVLQQTPDFIQVEATLLDGSDEPVRKQIGLAPKEIQTPDGPVTVWLIQYERIA